MKKIKTNTELIQIKTPKSIFKTRAINKITIFNEQGVLIQKIEFFEDGKIGKIINYQPIYFSFSFF
ncbi:hypothetical protein ['Camptotheca acuminata' phytoplasma]|uniref:hypothetical protein n=1 Tax='Camptotheca acuminata' phytoplasma TaxID=3239192 RepID=UPI00351A4BBD